MKRSEKSIRAHLEEQARSEIKKPQRKIKRPLSHYETLRLNWKDAVIFSLIVFFGCGYWFQAGTFAAL